MSFEGRLKELDRFSRRDPSVLDRREIAAWLGEGSWVERMLLCRLIGRVDWRGYSDLTAVAEFVLTQTRDENRFVRAWSMDALAGVAAAAPRLRPQLDVLIQEAMEAGPAAMAARARNILRRLNRAQHVQ